MESKKNKILRNVVNKECKHISKEEWERIINTIDPSLKSLILVDGFNAQPLYVPTHDFKYFYPCNEFEKSPPLFLEDEQYLEWIEKQLKAQAFFLRIHVCELIEVMRKVVIKFKELDQISCHFYILNTECIKFLVQNCATLKAINFENSIGIRTEECLLLSKLSNVEHLNLMGSDIYEEDLEILLKNSRKLISLNICNNSGITGHCLTLINKSIERVDLRDCWRIESQRVIAMVRLQLQNLLELLINSGINDESLNEICDNCPNLRHLTISFDYFAFNDIYGRRILSDSGFNAIEKLVDLRILTLRHVGKLTDHSLQTILKGCKNLVHLTLNIRHRHKLTDEALGDIGVWCPKLCVFESVHNHFIGKHSIISISFIQNLEALVLRGNKALDNDITRVINSCKKLLYLSLDGCAVNELVLIACIQRATELQPKNQIFKASLMSTKIDRSALDENVLPPNLRIRVSGPNNVQHFSEFDGRHVVTGKLSWYFPDYWMDFN